MLDYLGYLIKQVRIKLGVATKDKDYLISVIKFPESTKKPVDSNWSIRIISRDERPIEKCRILLNGKELPWWDKTECCYYVKYTMPHGSGNVRIPKEDYTEEVLQNTEGEVKDGENTLRKFKFKDLPFVDG
jgi:hypothetical protein